MELASLFYERVAFHDIRGVSVPVVGRAELAALPRSPPVYTSFYNLRPYEIDWLPPQIDVASVGENEIVYLTASNVAGSADRRLDLQGYEPVDLPVRLLPLQRWPEARQVALTPDRSEAPAVPHRVVFPDAPVPEGWRDESGRLLEIVAGATTEDGGNVTTHWVTQASPVFRLTAGARFRFQRFGEFVQYRYRLSGDGDEIRVLVDWPRFAFLDLRFPHRHPGFPAARSSVMVWTEGTSAIGGRLVAPGHARFAYLPEGDYMAEVSWWKGRRPLSSWRLRAPFRLTMGLNAYVVKDDEFVAESSR